MMSQKTSPGEGFLCHDVIIFAIWRNCIIPLKIISTPKHTAETQYVAVVGKESSGEKCILRFLVAGARGLNDCMHIVEILSVITSSINSL